MSFTGILLAESLRKEAVLDGVPFIVQRMWRRDAGDPAARQPLTWTFIMFEVPAASAGLFAERLSTALTSGPWYCDLHDADETIVVFAGQIFRYARGDQAASPTPYRREVARAGVMAAAHAERSLLRRRDHGRPALSGRPLPGEQIAGWVLLTG